jgi:hypothetical protein
VCVFESDPRSRCTSKGRAGRGRRDQGVGRDLKNRRMRKFENCLQNRPPKFCCPFSLVSGANAFFVGSSHILPPCLVISPISLACWAWATCNACSGCLRALQAFGRGQYKSGTSRWGGTDKYMAGPSTCTYSVDARLGYRLASLPILVLGFRPVETPLAAQHLYGVIIRTKYVRTSAYCVVPAVVTFVSATPTSVCFGGQECNQGKSTPLLRNKVRSLHRTSYPPSLSPHHQRPLRRASPTTSTDWPR